MQQKKESQKKKQKERKKDSMNASFVPKFVIFRKHSFLEKMFDKMWRYYFTWNRASRAS